MLQASKIQETWALPFKIVRQHPERPSLIKSRPVILYSQWGRKGARNGTPQPRPFAGLSLVYMLFGASGLWRCEMIHKRKKESSRRHTFSPKPLLYYTFHILRTEWLLGDYRVHESGSPRLFKAQTAFGCARA